MTTIERYEQLGITLRRMESVWAALYGMATHLYGSRSPLTKASNKMHHRARTMRLVLLNSMHEDYPAPDAALAVHISDAYYYGDEGAIDKNDEHFGFLIGDPEYGAEHPSGRKRARLVHVCNPRQSAAMIRGIAEMQNVNDCMYNVLKIAPERWLYMQELHECQLIVCRVLKEWNADWVAPESIYTVLDL